MTEPTDPTVALQERWSSSLMNNYGTPKVALRAGKGAVLTGVDGREYLDLLGGIAVNILGHGSQAIIDAVSAQLATLGHTSNLYVSEPVIKLAESLLSRWGVDGKAFFCNSGAEANEAAFKIARLTGRPEIIAAEKAFHGRTMGALAMTGQPAKRAPFEPMPAGVRHVPYGDLDAKKAAIGPQTAAVILEPIMGESGVVVPPVDYLASVRALTSEHGALLILDEVQTGIARTGTFYAHQATGITPDVMTLAKGLGGGLPIGAVLATGRAADLLEPGLHGTTFGGNPVCAAAALAVLEQVDSLDLANHAARLGKHITSSIAELDHQLIDHTRGSGLLIGIVLTEPVAPAVEAAARERGYLINAPGPDIVRLAPPLILTEEQATAFVNDLPAILDAAKGATS